MSIIDCCAREVRFATAWSTDRCLALRRPLPFGRLAGCPTRRTGEWGLELNFGGNTVGRWPTFGFGKVASSLLPASLSVAVRTVPSSY